MRQERFGRLFGWTRPNNPTKPAFAWNSGKTVQVLPVEPVVPATAHGVSLKCATDPGRWPEGTLLEGSFATRSPERRLRPNSFRSAEETPVSPSPSSTAGDLTDPKSHPGHHPCSEEESLCARPAVAADGDASLNEEERSTPIRHGIRLPTIRWRVVFLSGFAVLTGVSATGLILGLRQGRPADRRSVAARAEIEFLAEALPARLPATSRPNSVEPPAAAVAVLPAGTVAAPGPLMPPAAPALVLEHGGGPATSGIALTGATRPPSPVDPSADPTVAPAPTDESPRGPATGAVLAGGIADDEEVPPPPSIIIRANPPSP